MEIIKKYWFLIVIGLLLRVILAAFTYHPDLKSQVIATTSYLSGNFDPYQKASEISSGAVLDKLPMSYFLQLPAHLVGRVLVMEESEKSFFQQPEQIFGQIQGWLYLVYAKLPLIIFDMALGILLAYSLEKSLRKKALIFWMFNPFTLWATVSIGQIDIYATFFIVLAYLFVKKEKLSLAALALGFGGAIKSAPFLLLPLLLGMASTFKEKVKIIILSFLPLIVTIAPYLDSAEFKKNALFAPQMEKSLFAKILLSGGEAIFIVPTLLVIIYFFFYQQKRVAEDFLKYSAVILLTVLAFTHFHIQWFLWVTPLLIIIYLQRLDRSLKLSLWTMSICVIGMLFLFESSLQVRLFSPLLPGQAQSLGLAEILSSESIGNLRSFFASLFAASVIFFNISILNNGKK